MYSVEKVMCTSFLAMLRLKMQFLYMLVISSKSHEYFFFTFSI